MSGEAVSDDDWPHPTTSVQRTAVQAICPACGGTDIQRYPVLANDGWFMSDKCQYCLTSLVREPWHRLGSVRLPEEGVL